MTETEAKHRADELLTGVYSVQLKVDWHIIPNGPMVPALNVDGYVPVLRDAIADAILSAARDGERMGLERAAQHVDH